MNNLKPLKERTNNKIALCQNCMGVLTPAQQKFCNNYCQRAKTEIQAERDRGSVKIWVYLNKNMLDLAKSEHVLPHEFSHFIWSGHELTGVARFDVGALEGIGDLQANTYDAWWREIDRLNTSFERLSQDNQGKGGKGHRPRVMRRTGLLSYLCDEYGLSTEKNIALAIGEITEEEGLANPLILFNSL